MTSINDSQQPQDTSPEPAPRKPLNSSWVFTVAGGLVGVYFLVSGAWMFRDKYGDGVFALMMTAIVLATGTIGYLLFKTWRAERAARK
ncbi:hypothetical protein [Actinoplanes missouriensis]|uniref:hypothetical protein n=1 Tax=Actinoplanes missouriensis TaxID=1866 RepID=UPI00369998A3